MRSNELRLIRSVQSTAGGLPAIAASRLSAALALYVDHISKEEKAVDHYRSRLRWFTRWLDACGVSADGLLYQEDFLAFELWLRSARSARQELMLNDDTRISILKRLRGALRWGHVAGYLQHDYSVWVPVAFKAIEPVSDTAKVEILKDASLVVVDNNITTANLRAYLEMFLVAKLAQGLQPRTLTHYKDLLSAYFNWVDDHEGLNPTSAIALEYFMAYRRTINSRATVKTSYSAIRCYFNWLIKRRLIRQDDAPTRSVEPPKVPRKRMRYVTTEEFDRIYKSIKGDSWIEWRDRAMFTILFYCGLRAAETYNLTVRDINRRDKVINVRQGKGGKDRDVPYPDHLEELIDNYLERRPPTTMEGHLFLSADGVHGVRGKMEYDGFKMIVRRRATALNLTGLRLHAFRHGFAMWALNNGMALAAVSKAMGHHSVTVTESVYAHWTVKGLRAEYDGAFGRLKGEGHIAT